MTESHDRPRRVTLRDVGKLAGVDASIASRVLGGEQRRVTDETRQRIFAAADQLGWRPFAAARSLRKGTTSVLAVVVPSLYNPAYSAMMQGIQRAAASSGHVVVFSDANGDGTDPTTELERLSSYVDGIIWASARSDQLTDDTFPLTVAPTVLLNRRGVAGLPAVIGPDAAGARIAARHLLALGHTRVGLLTGPTTIDTAQRRIEAFRDECERGGAVVVWQESVELTIDAAATAATPMLALPRDSRPSAVFAAGLNASLGILRAARDAGVDVPDELSVVGLDDAEVAEIVTPPLTTVRMPHTAMGMEAVRSLLRRLDGDRLPLTVEVDEAPELIVRGSTRQHLERVKEN